MFYLHNVGAPVLFYVFDEFIETRRQWLTMANSAVCLSCIRYNYFVVRLLVLFLLNRNEIINIEKLLIKVKTLLILKSVGAVRLFVTFVVNDWCLFQSFSDFFSIPWWFTLIRLHFSFVSMKLQPIKNALHNNDWQIHC